MFCYRSQLRMEPLGMPFARRCCSGAKQYTPTKHTTVTITCSRLVIDILLALLLLMYGLANALAKGSESATDAAPLTRITWPAQSASER